MKSKIVLAIVVCILAFTVTGCMVDSPSPTPTSIVIPDEVLNQVEILCRNAAGEIVSDNVSVIAIDAEICETTINKEIQSRGGWPDPNDFPSESFLLAGKVLDNWFGHNMPGNTDHNREVLMYYMCTARHTLQDEGYIPLPTEDPECQLPQH
jgi:hypothetical protein